MGGPPASGPTGLDAALAEALLRTSGALTVVLACDGTVLRWGEACERLTGWSAAERVGGSFWELVPPDDRDTARGVFDRLLGDREHVDSCHCENVWLTRRGERRLVAWSATAVRDADGRVSAVLATGLDVTERAGAEEALRRQARRLEALAEASRVFASGLDYKTTLDTVARRLSELIGDGALIRVLSGDGTWLVPVAVWHPSPERAALRRRLLASSPQRTSEGITAQVIAGRRTLRVPEVTREFVRNEMKPEYWPYLEGVTSLLIAPLEHRRQVFGHITLMRDQGGAPYSREDETLLEDLAQRAAQAIENARLYGEAQAAIAARDEFLSIASHELRTPLTALRLALENMRRVATREALETLPAAHVERVLGTAERQGQRLEKLVAALLDVSRIHMGRLELELEDVELGSAVAEAVASVEEEAAQSGSTIEVQGSPVHGRWDRLRVSQVATNLLSNAVKYGAGRPVHVRYEQAGDEAVLVVHDQGIGIDPADQLQIFERFERAVSSRNYGGLGLGLFIVKRIVEAHAGTISVESHPGEGATFKVELPLRPPAAASAGGAEHAAH